MILVLGSVRIHADRIDDALALSHTHVRRSRAEPGCITHAVHRDGEDAQRLVFVEQWSDMAALQQHFRVPESRGFVKALAAMALEAPRMDLFHAQPVAVTG